MFTSIPTPVASFTRDVVSRHSTIQIDSSISPEVFKLVLEFLYTGNTKTSTLFNKPWVVCGVEYHHYGSESIGLRWCIYLWSCTCSCFSFHIMCTCVNISGSVSELGNNDDKRDIAMDLINVARMFELIELKTICENVLNEREYLNPSLGSAVCDRTGERLKDLFLNCVDTSDVVFIVKGRCT